MNATPHAERLDEAMLDERQRAARILLRRPMLTSDGPGGEHLPLVRRHRDALAAWFLEELGYRLVVESDFARLHKSPGIQDAVARGLAARSGTPFDTRHYALMCLVLAVLDQADQQTTLARIADEVRVRAAQIAGLAIDFDRGADRWAFVHAVRMCVDFGVLQLRDGDDERFARGEQGGDALYRVHHRRIAQMLSAPVSPSLAQNPDDLVVEPYADTADGRARRTRHRLLRTLVEEPTLLLEDLDPSEREYFSGQRPRIVQRLERGIGFVVELRAEGLSAIDPSGEASDIDFPAEGTIAHAALVVAEELVARARRGETTASRGDVEALLRDAAVKYKRWWRPEFVETLDGHERLADLALARLAAFGLIRIFAGEILVRPVAARFASVAPQVAGAASDDGPEDAVTNPTS